MAEALRSCDVYCCTGCGFTGTQLYNKGHGRRHTVQRTAPGCEGRCVKLWHVIALPVWVERWHQVWAESTCVFCDRQSSLLTATWDQADVTFHDATVPSGPGRHHCRDCTITLRQNTLGWTPLDEWSACRRDLCLTKHNTHKTQHSQHTTLTTHNTHNRHHSQHTTLTTHNTHNTQHSQHTTYNTHNIQHTTLTKHNTHNTQHSQHTTLTTDNNHNIQHSLHTTLTTQHSQQTDIHMPLAGFKPAFPKSEPP